VSGGIGPVAATTPYAWPWDGGCPGARLALVVAGWDPGWRSRVDADPAAAAERAVRTLVTAVAGACGTVVTVAHGPAPRTTGQRSFRLPAAASVDPRRIDGAHAVGARRVDAAGIDGFHGSGLDATLRAAGATHLLLAGHGLEAPVHSTLRSANDRGYECLLVLDASSPLRPDLVPAARSMVEMSGGIFGAVGATRDVLAALVPAAAPAPVTVPPSPRSTP
jgi:hypothetical protein